MAVPLRKPARLADRYVVSVGGIRSFVTQEDYLKAIAEPVEGAWIEWCWDTASGYLEPGDLGEWPSHFTVIAPVEGPIEFQFDKTSTTDGKVSTTEPIPIGDGKLATLTADVLEITGGDSI